MSNFIMIKNSKVEIKIYKGQRVVTVWDISLTHSKSIDSIMKVFKRNKNKFS